MQPQTSKVPLSLISLSTTPATPVGIKENKMNETTIPVYLVGYVYVEDGEAELPIIGPFDNDRAANAYKRDVLELKPQSWASKAVRTFVYDSILNKGLVTTPEDWQNKINPPPVPPVDQEWIEEHYTTTEGIDDLIHNYMSYNSYCDDDGVNDLIREYVQYEWEPEYDLSDILDSGNKDDFEMIYERNEKLIDDRIESWLKELLPLATFTWKFGKGFIFESFQEKREEE